MSYTQNHTIYKTKFGEEVPSATTILKILNKPSIVKWANFLGYKKLNVGEVLEDYSSKGTYVHSIINSIFNHKKVKFEKGRGYTKDIIFRCLDNFFKWTNNNIVTAIFTERPFISDDLMIGGTLDFYGTVNGLNTLVDFKTSKKIRYVMFIQLAIYTILLEEYHYKVDQVGIVLVNEYKGGNKFISREELNPYIDIALTLIKLFHMYYNLNKKEWNEDII